MDGNLSNPVFWASLKQATDLFKLDHPDLEVSYFEPKIPTHLHDFSLQVSDWDNNLFAHMDVGSWHIPTKNMEIAMGMWTNILDTLHCKIERLKKEKALDALLDSQDSQTL